MNLKGNQDQFAFAGTHEYTIVFAKNKAKFSPSAFKYDVDELEEWDEDDIGMYKKGAPLRATGTEANREDRPLMFYPIIIDIEDNAFTINKEEHSFIYDAKKRLFDDKHLQELINKYTDLGYEVVLPMVDNNQYGRWRWGYNDNTINRLLYDIIVSRTKNGISLYKKQRPELGDLPTKKPKSIFYKPEYSSGNGTSQLKDIFKDKRFNNPKPLDLIKDFFIIGSNKNSQILDFFAGSGTTLHATMVLNAEDGGKRQCILITNNENNICEEVTYERNKRVIEGYTNA
jgi:adenine-specific DNA-methyltransferase